MAEQKDFIEYFKEVLETAAPKKDGAVIKVDRKQLEALVKYVGSLEDYTALVTSDEMRRMDALVECTNRVMNLSKLRFHGLFRRIAFKDLKGLLDVIRVLYDPRTTRNVQ